MGRPKGSKNKVNCPHYLPFNLDEDIAEQERNYVEDENNRVFLVVNGGGGGDDSSSEEDDDEEDLDFSLDDCHHLSLDNHKLIKKINPELIMKPS